MDTAAISPLGVDTGHDFSVDRALVNAFLHNVPDHIYFKDLNSRFITASTSQLKVLGISSEAEVRGRSDFDFFAADHATRAFDDEQTIIRTGQPMLSKLENETWPDGRVTWVLTSKLPLRNDRGDIIGTFGVSKDVTKEKETELALKHAQNELVNASRLAGMAEVATGVLHNVGNVLNSLNVSASVISAGLKESKADSLAKLSALLRQHAADLGDFMATIRRVDGCRSFSNRLPSTHSLNEIVCWPKQNHSSEMWITSRRSSRCSNRTRPW